MQPSVTNVSVKFDLKVPKMGTTYQCPDKLPPIYAGEKLVVYGLVDASTATTEGTAILKGDILGKPFQHNVPFRTQPNSSSDLYPVHRLAAKALIADWQDTKKSKVAIVGVSVEAGVVSSHTAFIAVDEESSKPVEGALQTWDIQAQYVESKEEEEEKLFSCMALAAFQSSPCKSRKKKGGFLYGLRFGGQKKKSMAKKDTAYHSRAMPAPELEEFDDSDDDMGEEVKFSEEMASLPKPKPGRSAVPSTPYSAASTRPTDILSLLIAHQHADGSWQLSPAISQIFSKTMKEVEDACPVQLSGETPVVGVVWATILVLTVLEKKCKGQRDEWELIAMKAEKWLKKQVLPAGVETSKFYTAARSLV